MLKTGIIGCGRIADQHASELLQVTGCKIAAFCDREVLLAEQMADRYQVDGCFTDARELLEKAKPDVVHITTPPQSHFELGMLCLDAGCHVLMEKPFAINASQTEALIRRATERNVKITVCHNAQFSHAAIRMRELIANGFLGGNPVHMDSVWCYPFTDPGYAKAILGDANHWIRKLPGRYLHDILPHGIARIAEYMQCDNPTVIAHGSVSPMLQSMGENDIIDELRVIIHDKANMSAYYTFSSQITPPIKQFKIHGPKKSLILDHEHQTVIEISKNYKLYLNHILSPLDDAKKYAANSLGNFKRFIGRKHHFEYGRRYLIEQFYRSIAEGTPLPVSYREIILTTRILDNIFQQIYSREAVMKTNYI
jgi:predicted dehydrogenase